MSMGYIDLDRSFVPIKKGEEPRVDLNTQQGRSYGGWLDWSALLKHQRVVLLAEAGCGKTTEFRHQAERLREAGDVAFFARIEDLQDGISRALEIGTSAGFAAWKDGEGVGYFLLDSVDEARLGRKRLDKALRCLAEDIGNPALSRAHIFISCRASDWRGDEDPATFEERLPLTAAPPARSASPTKPNSPFPKAYILPLRNENGAQREKAEAGDAGNTRKTSAALLVVRLAPLDTVQQRLFIKRKGVQNPDYFMDCLCRRQLEALAQRPGDLQSLVDYWADNGTFDSLSTMLEVAIKVRLTEINLDRPKIGDVSPEKARQGAERLAAGLVLGQSFTLRAPALSEGKSPDTGNPGAVDLLPDWLPQERDNLLARSLFVPTTYGHIRFYHRWAQEYLAACWLHRLLATPGNRIAIHKMLFTERYNVEMVAAPLRPTAAWLALKDDKVRAEMIKRAPFALIEYGDPTALPVADRIRLLLAMSAKPTAGAPEIAPAVWQVPAPFADPAMADAINQAWNDRPELLFRVSLLNLVRDGKITSCVQRAVELACDKEIDGDARSAALKAIHACDDLDGLRRVAEVIKSNPESTFGDLVSSATDILFPKYLDTTTLTRIIAAYDSDSIEFIMGDVLYRCKDQKTRLSLIREIANYCMTEETGDNKRSIKPNHELIADALQSCIRAYLTEQPTERDAFLDEILSVRSPLDEYYDQDDYEDYEDDQIGQRRLRYNFGRRQDNPEHVRKEEELQKVWQQNQPEFLARLIEPKTAMEFDTETFLCFKVATAQLIKHTAWAEQAAQNSADDARRAANEVFGRDVANAYLNLAGLFWRTLPCPYPAAKAVTSGLAKTAIAIEAATTTDWAKKLPDYDVEKALEHVGGGEGGNEHWIAALLDNRADIVLPGLVAMVEREWRLSDATSIRLLTYYAASQTPAPGKVCDEIIRLLTQEQPRTPDVLTQALAILANAAFDISDDVLASLRQHLITSKDAEYALGYFDLLLGVDAEMALDGITSRFSSTPSRESAENLVSLYLCLDKWAGADGRPLTESLPPKCLQKLIILGKCHLPHADTPEDPYSDHRLEVAYTVQGDIITALENHPHRANAYDSMKLLATDNILSESTRLAFAKRARRMAEHDSIPEPWAPDYVIAFERKGLLPARNGDELLALIAGILEDINLGFTQSDASSCDALRACPDENAVQGWLVEQLNLRAYGRYSATQETIAVGRNRMDVLVKAANMRDELAIEIKHGGKNWSSAQLRDAMEMQLSDGYLLPSTRRHGILVVTNHKQGKCWQHPDSKDELSLPKLISWLQEHADRKMREPGYERTLRAIGLDAAPPDRGAASKGRSAKPINNGKA